MTHTPGPWEASGWAVYECSNERPVARAACASMSDCNLDPDEEEWCERSGTSNREASANARLIAAAPDLLEALRSLLPLAVHVSPEDVAIHTARAAIEKATGQEPAK